MKNNSMILCYAYSALPINESRLNTNYRIASIVCVILTVLAITLNALVIFAMISEKRYKRPPDVLLIMLSISDLLAGLTVALLFAVRMYFLSIGQPACHISLIVAVFAYSLLGISIITIATISIELCLAIVKPFIYSSRTNQGGYLKIILSLWVLLFATSFSISHLSRFYWRIFKVIVCTISIFIYICVCVSHVYIQRETKTISNRSPSENSIRNSTVHNKVIRMTTFIILAFGLCYIPNFLYNTHNLIWGYTPWLGAYIGVWCDVIALFSVILDPLIYCVRLKTIRKRILRLFDISILRRRTNNRIHIAVCSTE